MVSDVIEFLTNHKAVNFFGFLNDISVTVRNFYTKFFALCSEKLSEFFTIEFLPIGPPFNVLGLTSVLCHWFDQGLSKQF